MEKLQSLLKEADDLAPGSSKRMDTLEQIRSMLMDRYSTFPSTAATAQVSHSLPVSPACIFMRKDV